MEVKGKEELFRGKSQSRIENKREIGRGVRSVE